MAEKKEYATRFGMGVLALLFLVTSVGFSLLVIWQTKQNKKQQDAITQSQQTAQDSTAADTTKKEDSKMIQGTKLTDFNPVENVDKLQVIDLKEGDGDVVKAGDTITAHYTGALASDGTIFQSSLDTGKPFTSPLSGLIKGWQEGIPGMKVGGTRRLMIPSAQAYGSQAQDNIPANSDLVFDIQLISIEK